MQTIYSFSYNPAIATGTNTTNTVWRMAYQQPIMLYRGTANNIKIVVFNNNQQVVDLTNFDVQIQLVDRETKEHFVTRTATIDSPTSGVATVLFTEADLRNLQHRFYHMIARLMPEGDGSTIVAGEILYLDDNYGAFTPVTLEDAWNFSPGNLPAVTNGELRVGNIIPLLNNTYYLGNVDYRWHSLYTGNVKVGNITINGSSISTAPSAANNLILTANRHSMIFSDVSVGNQGIGATLQFDDIENSSGPRFETWYGNVATPTDPPGQHSLDIYAADANSYVEFGSHDENTFMGVDNAGAFIYTNWTINKNQRWSFGPDGSFGFPNNGRVINNSNNVQILFNENNLTISTQDPDGSTLHFSSFNETGGMTIDGDTIPLGNNLHDLGAPANQWKQVHVSDAIILNGVFLRINESNYPTIDGIPIGSSNKLINSIYEVVLQPDASISYPGDITQNTKDGTICFTGVDTVIYTATARYQHAIKMFVMIEGIPGTGSGLMETQACDIIAVRGFVNDVVHVTAYGVTYSGAAPLATFDGQWNAISNRIEIICMPTSTVNPVIASVYAIEMNSND